MKPFVLLNMAMTADGKTATANRVVSSFGSPLDAHHLLSLRTTADAVICGARTAEAPDVTLGPGGLRYQKMRRNRHLDEFNLRVVVSGDATLQVSSAVFSETRSPLIVITSTSAPKSSLRRLERAGAVLGKFGTASIDLAAALAWLHDEWKVHRIVCEGGSTLNDTMLRAGLIDEIHVTVCPCIFGGRSAPTLVDGVGFQTLEAALKLEEIGRRQRGGELFLRYRVLKPQA